MKRLVVIALAWTAAASCDSDSIVISPDAGAPVDLFYTLEPSGDPEAPAGLLLRWSPPPGEVVEFYRVYSRGTGADFALRGETTSLSFHDEGIPHLEYYVTALTADGESDPSNVVLVDERLRLETPATLFTTSLDGAIHLRWSDNPFLSAPDGFREYRVYSTAYSLDEGVCGASWALEGTTVAPEFLVGALANGVPRCHGVSAVSIEGFESLWSPLRQDTPRPDGRNVLLWAFDVFAPESGFRVWSDANGDGRAQRAELALVQDGNRTDIDFWIFRDPVDQSLWFVPERTGVDIRLYSLDPIDDLTAIDVAPAGGYTRDAIEAVPGFGYVLRIDVGDGFFRYAGLRVTHVGPELLIFDWSFQDDPGNPELRVVAGIE